MPLALAVLSALVAAPALGQADSDGDGALDSADVFPCDATRSAVAYAPAQGAFGTLAFEDQWPYGHADRDFNDLNLAWNLEYGLTADGRVARLRAVLDVRAIGADDRNGLAFHLPVPRDALAAATRTVGAVTTNLAPSTVDADLVLVVSNDLRELFGDRPGPINSDPNDSTYDAAPVVLELTFSTPVGVDLAAAPHDLFIFASANPSHEIHRPEYSGTAAMDPGLFGYGIDGSSPSRSFVDDTGLPYALVFPSVVDYPAEGVAIEALYPEITAFAASAGTSNTSFYVNAQVASAYAAATPPTFVAPPEIDAACVPTTFSGCREILAQGGSTGDGVYQVDMDGPGGRAPVDVYCDMTTDGGGWTHVMHVRTRQTNRGEQNVGALPNRTTQAKLSDADIIALARGGQREVQMHRGATRYIFRYSDAQWQSYSTTGWTNAPHDAKRADGVWLGNRCNGHWNNRGFSSWDDSPYGTCDTPYAGPRAYMTPYHTSYSYAPGAVFDVYVR